jgi:hypothetical protein
LNRRNIINLQARARSTNKLGWKKNNYKGKSVATIIWLEQKPLKTTPKNKASDIEAEIYFYSEAYNRIKSEDTQRQQQPKTPCQPKPASARQSIQAQKASTRPTEQSRKFSSKKPTADHGLTAQTAAAQHRRLKKFLRTKPLNTVVDQPKRQNANKGTKTPK